MTFFKRPELEGPWTPTPEQRKQLDEMHAKQTRKPRAKGERPIEPMPATNNAPPENSLRKVPDHVLASGAVSLLGF
jgi:hypothetical protein